MIVKPSISFLTADSNPKLAQNTTTVVTSMTGNKTYDKPSPDLAVITAANTEFITAIANAVNGGKEMTSIKNDKRAALVVLMRQLANYVAVACLGDMTKLLSSGFPVQKPDRVTAPIPAMPVSPVLSQGQTGVILASSSPVAGAYVYNWQLALASAPLVIVQHGQSTKLRRAFTGLTPG